jgi:NADH-quinone oxidoreductase subunit M
MLCLLALPLVAGILVALLGPNRGDAVRWISLGASILSLLMACSLTLQFMMFDGARDKKQEEARLAHVMPTFRPVFVPGSPGVVRDEKGNVVKENEHGTSWDLLPIGSGVVQFYLGVDGLNVWLILLTAALMVPSVLVSWTYISERVNEFFAWLLMLQTAMMGIFMSFDIILFYVFFELSLVPLFFLIGIWGGPERRHAAGKFFIYTLTGSLITLLGVIGIVIACYAKTTPGELTFSVPRLVQIVHQQMPDIPPTMVQESPKLAEQLHKDRQYWSAPLSPNDIWQIDVLGFFGLSSRKAEEAPFRWGGVMFWVFLALMAGFAIKVPLVPFHTWLPLAHVEAPTAGSVDLAGVLLKIGAYGFLRLCLPLAPDTSVTIGLPLISTLAVIGIVYGAFCAYAQDDIKKLVAYSSVSHLGLCMLGMFALNSAGISGSIMQMINHGFSTAGLFLLVGMLYERYHTRRMSDYGGMASKLKVMAALMVFVCMSSAGLPGLNGFIGEVLCLMGAYQQQYLRQQFPIFAIIGATGMLLGAWYLLTMLQRVFFGTFKEPPVSGHEHHGPTGDLNFREVMTMVPVVVFCVLIGVFPQPILNSMKADVAVIEAIADKARTRQEQTPAPTRTAANHREEAQP